MALTHVIHGPCVITASSVVIGYTRGDVTVVYEEMTHEQKVNEFGEMVTDIIHIGDRLEVELDLIELIGASAQFISPAGTYVSGTKTVSFGRKPGVRRSTSAAELTISPVAESYPILTIYKATPIGGFNLKFGGNEDSALHLKFKALPDTSKSDGLLLGTLQLAA